MVEGNRGGLADIGKQSTCDQLYRYSLALELPDKFKELRVLQERLELDSQPFFVREQTQVSLHKTVAPKEGARFMVDWHLVALPLIQVQSEADPVHIFKTWLGQMAVIAPAPH